jgi:hypothetical protein
MSCVQWLLDHLGCAISSSILAMASLRAILVPAHFSARVNQLSNRVSGHANGYILKLAYRTRTLVPP